MASQQNSGALRVLVTGAAGRMGAAVIAALEESSDLVLAAATEREGRAPDLDVPVATRLEDVLGAADVVIDFTTPEATRAHARACAESGVALVVGTTGLSPEAREELRGHAARIPVVLAPNMSVGVNLLFVLARQVAGVLGEEFDVEILEAHHRHKRDAPSGTALHLAEAVAQGLGLDAREDLIHAREGDVGPRPPGKIGMQVVRGGDVVGDHTVFFLGDGERVELTHRATSRANFARGAVRAARWIASRPPGLYDMLDVLGLRAPEEKA